MAQNWPTVSGTSALNAAVKTDLPDRSESLRTVFSGASAPSNPAAYQLWADTTTKMLRQRNAANSAWVDVLPLLGNGGSMSLHLAPGALAAGTLSFPALPVAATIRRIILVSGTTTSGSVAATTEWTFMLRNLTAANVALFSATPSTATNQSGIGGGEMTANTAYVLNANQNVSANALDVLQLVVTKVGSPTVVASYTVVLDFFERGV